eukprot:TRINITY_DN4876_c0_g1_i4.p1 TRINITY_DN4876_c0_g1~~TRINITY_DN4876_c0_g1_i4.p1  ORF type:complete len:276 (+),score=50.94 TRINITY_DN4876_c0_g1_i4:89-916(+)
MASSARLLPYLFLNNSLKPLLGHIHTAPPKVQFLSYMRLAFYMDKEVPGGFSSVYSSVLQAIADNDLDYLKGVMEPKLFSFTEEKLKDLERLKLKSVFVQEPLPKEPENEEEEEFQLTLNRGKRKTGTRDFMADRAAFLQGNKPFIDGNLHFIIESFDMQMMFEARGVYGVSIDRSQNGPATNYKTFELKKSNKTFYLAGSDWMSLIRNQILVMNVYFWTTRKLYIEDEEGDIRMGSSQPSTKELHKWRFETYIPNIDWVLTDMDDVLLGNNYIS